MKCEFKKKILFLFSLTRYPLPICLPYKMFHILNCIFYRFLYFNASYCTLLQINCCTTLFTRNACAYTYFSIFSAFYVLLQLYVSSKCIKMRSLLIMQVTTSCNNKVLQGNGKSKVST